MEYKFLGKVNNPEELKKLNEDETKQLCSEIREKIMHTVSINGGHLASNLGIVELTVAVHKAFNAPKDSIIFDVGHQCYTHKLLTERYEHFDTLRQKDGISGFMRPDESEYDPIITGHSSNSISAACGIAKANTLDGNDNFTVAIIGDGALAGGMAMEGMNNAASNRDRLIIIINDNKMSISKNVGAISKYLNNVRTNPSYYHLKAAVEKTIIHIPLIGSHLRNTIYNSKLMLKNVIYHSNVFEGLGFNYLGPVDGHNIDKLSKVLEIAKAEKRPVVIHALTIKGKGYKYAEAMPNSYHGVAPFNVEVGIEAAGKTNFSNEFGKELCSIAKDNSKVCAITAAMTEGTGLSDFANSFPERFFDVGISEQHAVTFAAGLAAKGYKPFFAVYSSFLQRGFDQILHDAAIANLPVTLCIDRAGLVGNDGETHQGIFDVSFLSAIPNVKIFSPSSYKELKFLLNKAADRTNGVWAIRYPRGSQNKDIAVGVVNGEDYTVVSNKSQTAVISYGAAFSNCVEALNAGEADLIKLNLINSFSDSLIDKLKSYKSIFFFEESVYSGSIGEKLSEQLLSNNYGGNFKHIAIADEFVKQATQSEQRRQFYLDADSIKEIVTGGKK